MYNKIFCKQIVLTAVLILGAVVFLYAQGKGPYFKDALKAKRTSFHKQIIADINKNLLLPLNSENEEALSSAFYKIALVKYKTALVDRRIDSAVKYMNSRGTDYKKSLLNLINSDYPKKFEAYIKPVFKNANNDAQLMAMAANYLLPRATKTDVQLMLKQTMLAFAKEPDNAILYELIEQLKAAGKSIITPSVKTFFEKDYLPGQVIVFSFQRKNRNYAGLAMVRNTKGDFVKNADSTYFSVGQLARSASNMPGYISNGNTPQGIFKMHGFDTSKSFFIGPTTNIQLSMPHEYHPLVVGEKLIDTTWSLQQYMDLLPQNFKDYHPLYGTFYAGKAGRSEIIAHGTTVDTAFYSGQPYAPYTPTAGCLCTKEIWNGNTAYVAVSDQQLLVQAILLAGGPFGYLIVIEINDKNTPVNLNDVLPFLK